MPVFPLSGEVITVRIPELPEESTLANEDKIPIWHASTNVTESVTLQTLRTFIETGGGGTVDPVYIGGDFLYIVPASAEGGDTISIPSIAGYSFTLHRDGYPMKPIDEYLVLSGGGAKLVGSTLIEGQRYVFKVYELSNGQPVAPSGGGSDFITGNTTVNTSISISVNDLNKVQHIRGGSNALAITLPDIDICPENSVVILETLIGNTKQHSITTTGGQYIYTDDESKTTIYIGKGECFWFYRSDDGWYLFVQKGNINVGVPTPAYKAGLNQVVCNGQTLDRVDYPRLWALIQTLGGGFVTEATWQTASVTVEGRDVDYPYRGCFSDGNGTTTFRLPDLRGMTLTGLNNYGGSDAGRYYNYPGGYQRHEFEAHIHEGKMGEGTGPASVPDNIGPSPLNNEVRTYETESTGGTKTRVDNIGVLWVINY